MTLVNRAIDGTRPVEASRTASRVSKAATEGRHYRRSTPAAHLDPNVGGSTRGRAIHRALRTTITLSVLAVTLAACGGDDADPTPTLVPPPAATVAAPAGATPAASPAASPVDPSALQPGEVTLGQVADRIAAAWPTVTSYRSETANLLVDGSPVPNAAVVTREVLLPDSKRFLAVEGDTTTEIVYVGSSLFTRVGDAPWTAVDASRLQDGDRFLETYAQMTQPVVRPYSGVSDRERERIGREGAVTSVGGRSCREYVFPEVGAVGERIEITLLVDAAGLPCMIETLTGSTRNRTIFAYNVPVIIEAPAGVQPSPIASPIPISEDQHEG